MEGKGTEITEQVLGAAIAVHRALGPGLLESTYEACLAFELLERRLRIERQAALPVVYRGVRIDCGYRCGSTSSPPFGAPAPLVPPASS